MTSLLAFDVFELQKKVIVENGMHVEVSKIVARTYDAIFLTFALENKVDLK